FRRASPASAGCLQSSSRTSVLPDYALPLRGPRKYHRISPRRGSTTTSTIHSAFFSFEAELCAICSTAHTSATSISRPQIPLHPTFISDVRSLVLRQVYAWALAQTVANQTFVRKRTVYRRNRIQMRLILLGIFT